MSSRAKPSRSGLLAVGSGGFVVTSRPRGGDWLASDLQGLKADRFSLVVSMLTAEEEIELLLSEEDERCRETGLEFLRFPIPDRCIPSDRMAFDAFVERVHRLLSNGAFGIFHCRAGLGRAPLLGCSVLMKEGCDADAAWDLIASRRGQAVPDTAEQRVWVSQTARQTQTLDEAFSALTESGLEQGRGDNGK